jgi:pilus assembly protein CpaE
MMNKDVKVLIISDESLLSAQIEPMLEGCSVERSAPEEVRKEFDRIAPDFVLLSNRNRDAAAEDIQYMMNLNPLVRVACIAKQRDFDFLREVIRSGAIDFFVLPEELSLLHNRLPSILNQIQQMKKNEQEPSAARTFKKGRGQIYTFYSAKGGSGRTLVAANFAQTMKLESTAQILLVDLNLQFGGVETLFSIESNRSLADLKPVVDELNENHIHNVTEREKHSQLEILLSPADGEIAESITAEFVSSLLRVCRRSFDFVIVDLPTEINTITYAALEEADRIFYVINPETPDIRMFKKAETMFIRLGMNLTDRMKVIYNKVSGANEVLPKDIEEFIAYPMEAKLRLDLKGVVTALNKGESLRKEAGEKKIPVFSKDIQKWVHGLLT